MKLRLNKFKWTDDTKPADCTFAIIDVYLKVVEDWL